MPEGHKCHSCCCLPGSTTFVTEGTQGALSHTLGLEKGLSSGTLALSCGCMFGGFTPANNAAILQVPPGSALGLGLPRDHLVPVAARAS